MKEYKVIKRKIALVNNTKNLEDLLNQYGRQGWRLVHFTGQMGEFVLEKDKNQ